jgi:hypothetical protein
VVIIEYMKLVRFKKKSFQLPTLSKDSRALLSVLVDAADITLVVFTKVRLFRIGYIPVKIFIARVLLDLLRSKTSLGASRLFESKKKS